LSERALNPVGPKRNHHRQIELSLRAVSERGCAMAGNWKYRWSTRSVAKFIASLFTASAEGYAATGLE
jgi:hypothetical protein